MSPASATPSFKGSFSGLAQQMIAAVLPVAAAICFLLFGELGWRLFLVSLAVVPLILLFAWVVSRLDRLRFDNQERTIRAGMRRPVGVDEVASVRFVQSMGLVQVSVTKKTGGSELLMVGLPKPEVERLKKALQARCPTAEIETRSYTTWRLIAVAVVALAAASLAGSAYLSRHEPATAVACVAAPESMPETAEPVIRKGEGIVARFPPAFQTLQFNVMRVEGFGTTGFAGRVFLRVAGIGNEWALFHYAACSRFGVVPTILKAALFSEWDDPRIYTAREGEQRWLLVAGQRGGSAEARIVAYNAEHDIEVMVAVRLAGQMSVERLAGLLRWITVEPDSRF